MAEVSVTIPSSVISDVEDVFGGTIDGHVQAVVDAWVEQMRGATKSQKRKGKMDRFDRLSQTKQNQVDAILATAPDPEPEPDPE